MKPQKEAIWSLKLDEIFSCYSPRDLPDAIRNYFEEDCDEIYLEIGNSSAGLKHIMERHENQFIIPKLRKLNDEKGDDDDDIERSMSSCSSSEGLEIDFTNNINDDRNENKEMENMKNCNENDTDSIPSLERNYQLVSEYIYNIMKRADYYYYGYKILPGKKIPERVTLALLYQLDFNKFLRVSMGTNGFIVTAVPQSINNYVHTSLC